jgi:hypothetical protein
MPNCVKKKSTAYGLTPFCPHSMKVTSPDYDEKEQKDRDRGNWPRNPTGPNYYTQQPCDRYGGYGREKSDRHPLIEVNTFSPG